MTQTICEGRDDMWHMDHCLSISHPQTKDRLYQLTKRFGRNDTEATIKVISVADTIQQGWSRHTVQKARKTGQLLLGDSITEDDIAQLDDGDFSEIVKIEGGKLFVGSAITESSLSKKQRLSRIFAHLHNIGEEEYEEFVEAFGELFAELYAEVFDGSYAGNNARLIAGLDQDLRRAGIITGEKYADVGCGTLAMANTLGVANDGIYRDIVSLDSNQYMLKEGKEMLRANKEKAGIVSSEPEVRKGSMVNMRKKFGNGEFDVVNCALALNYVRLNTNLKKNFHKDQRVQSICEMNRILKPGGIGIMTFGETRCHPNEFEKFKETLEKHFGFEVLPEYTGVGTSTDDIEGHKFRNYTLVVRKVGTPDITDLEIKDLRMSLTRQAKKSKPQQPVRETRARDEDETTSYIHTQFQVEEKQVEFGYDEETLTEQERMVRKAQHARTLLQRLHSEHGGKLDEITEETRERLRGEGVEVNVFYVSGGRTVESFRLQGESSSHLVFPLWGDEELEA